MSAPPRALAALFLLALLGVLAVGGLVALEVGGLAALLGYAAVALLLLGLGVVRLRTLVPAPAGPRQHCSCCDGDHLAPVRVV
jgi:hypothetical protein